MKGIIVTGDEMAVGPDISGSPSVIWREITKIVVAEGVIIVRGRAYSLALEKEIPGREVRTAPSPNG
jgi:hypothetical protein